MNVRAKYTEDGEYYEAVIEKIFENKYAVVRYLGKRILLILQMCELLLTSKKHK